MGREEGGRGEYGVCAVRREGGDSMVLASGGGREGRVWCMGRE